MANKKIFIVLLDQDRPNEYWDIKAVFSTRKRAEKYVEEAIEKRVIMRDNNKYFKVQGYFRSEWKIEVFEMNKEEFG